MKTCHANHCHANLAAAAAAAGDWTVLLVTAAAEAVVATWTFVVVASFAFSAVVTWLVGGGLPDKDIGASSGSAGYITSKVKVKGNVDLYSATSWTHL